MFLYKKYSWVKHVWPKQSREILTWSTRFDTWCPCVGLNFFWSEGCSVHCHVNMLKMQRSRSWAVARCEVEMSLWAAIFEDSSIFSLSRIPTCDEVNIVVTEMFISDSRCLNFHIWFTMNCELWVKMEDYLNVIQWVHANAEQFIISENVEFTII